MARENEEAIKKKIMDARKRGVCDKEGNTLGSFLRAKHGIEEKLVFVPTEQYRRNYDQIDWSTSKGTEHGRKETQDAESA